MRRNAVLLHNFTAWFVLGLTQKTSVRWQSVYLYCAPPATPLRHISVVS